MRLVPIKGKEEPEKFDGLTIEDIASRIKIGKGGAMKKFAEIDRNAVDRFRDPSVTAISGVGTAQAASSEDEDDYGDEGDMPDSQKIGPTSKLTTSIYTKVNAICRKRPDFRATLKDDAPPEAAEAPKVARRLFRKLWKQGGWNRIAKRAYLKVCISGMGFTAWYWDKDARKPCYEHVHPQNLSVDPCTTDWQNLKYAARLIRMPLREAMQKYPDAFADDDKLNQGGRLDKTKVKVWCYWDKKTEVHVLEDGWRKLKSSPNPYGGRIPILVAEGKIDPGFSIFALGDGVLAAGSQQEIEDVQNLISNKAKHNGPVTLYNSTRVESKHVEDARDGQWVPTKDLTASEIPIVRIGGEPITDAEMAALQAASASQDQLVGVNDAMRGALSQANATATEVSIVATQSGANSSDAQADYELFVDRWAETCLFMLQEYGGPEEGVNVSKREIAEWELLKWIDEVCVVESSTLYRDPNADLQQSQTLLQQAINSSEIYLSFAQLGVAFGGQEPVIPNLKAYQDKVLRASGVENTDDFWIAAPPPPQQPQENDAASLIKALQTIYKDSPPDVKRQIEQQFGLSPSEMGDLLQADGAAKPEPNPEMEIARQEDEQAHDAAKQSAQHGHELRMQMMKHQQAMELEQIRLRHAAQAKLADLTHKSRLQAEQNAAAEKQARIAAAAKPKAGAAK